MYRYSKCTLFSIIQYYIDLFGDITKIYHFKSNLVCVSGAKLMQQKWENRHKKNHGS